MATCDAFAARFGTSLVECLRDEFYFNLDMRKLLITRIRWAKAAVAGRAGREQRFVGASAKFGPKSPTPARAPHPLGIAIHDPMISRHPRYIFIAHDRLATARESAGDQRRGNSTLGRPYLTAELPLTTTSRCDCVTGRVRGPASSGGGGSDDPGVLRRTPPDENTSRELT